MGFVTIPSAGKPLIKKAKCEMLCFTQHDKNGAEDCAATKY